MIIIGLCIAGFTTTVGAISIKNDYRAATHAQDQLLGLDMNPVYSASPYLVGIVLGYILYKKYRPINKQVFTKPAM